MNTLTSIFWLTSEGTVFQLTYLLIFAIVFFIGWLIYSLYRNTKLRERYNEVKEYGKLKRQDNNTSSE